MADSCVTVSADPVDLSHHFSDITLNRKASSVKEFYKYFLIPGIGNLAGGLPNNNYFPFDTIEAKAALPQRFVPTPNKPVDPPAQVPTSDTSIASQVVVPKVDNEPDPLLKIDLKTALQYGTAQGYPPLYSFLRQFTRENLHPNVPYTGGPEIILTCGNTDGFAKTLDCLSNPWIEGKDWVRDRPGLLVEKFAYMNAIQAARPRGMNIVPVAIDAEGMLAAGPGGLEDVLENWDFTRGKRPHLIYTVTIGQNPTSGTLGVQRRRDIYAVCCKYDVLIVEDDPYWYLQFPSANAHSLAARGIPHNSSPLPSYDSIAGTQNYNSPKSSGYPFLDSLVPSYLSVDTQGRVIRLDTFSKTVAPGCRLGWITAQPAIVERFLRITEASTQQPSGFVQSIIAELIMGSQSDSGSGGAKDGSGWNTSGWVRWLEGLRGNYERRMNVMCTVLEDGKELVKSGRRGSLADDGWSVIEKTLLYDFVWPLGGMFIWVKVNLQSHPLFKKISPAKLARALWVFNTEKPYLLLVAPGAMFSPTEEISEKEGWSYFRLCFAAVDNNVLEDMAKRYVSALQAFWQKKNLDDIEEILVRGGELQYADMMPTGFC
ncbi:MAG: hypothetical protein MMC33_004065 [Icmadophila ericetorum]|nr:hypothetical protein [Icmadophila ericetorum]